MSAKEKCFACGKAMRNPNYAETADGQKVDIGPECFQHVLNAGPYGYQPPRGGPKIYLAGFSSAATHTAAQPKDFFAD